MSIFNAEENIKKIKWKDIVSPVSYSVTSKKYSLSLFFRGEDLNHLTFIGSNDLKSEGPDGLCDLSYSFSEKIFTDDFYINPENDISKQLSDVLEDLTEFKIKVDKTLVRFDIKIHPTLISTYEQYMIRHNFGQRGFEHPDRVVYIHIILGEDIHWFYPIYIK